MYLSRVAIKNYRSIKQLEVALDPRCRILVGINESGKTNILTALNLLDPKVSTTRRDLRERGLREEPITEAHVRFIFGFTKEETSEISASAKEDILSKTYKSPIVTIDGDRRTLDQLCESREGLYVANILTGKKYVSVWSLGKAQLINSWKKVGPACPRDYSVTRSSENLPLSVGTLVDTSEFTEIPPEYLEDASLEDLSAPMSGVIKKKVEAGLSRVLFWDYDERNLLPPRINLDQFCAQPDTCYSIFSNLKEKNIIFEGWRDKKLFEVAISRVPAEHEEVKQLKNFGRCFAQGVKQIKNITPLFEAGDRKCLILSDCDAVAREHQREYQQAKGYGEWKRYDEIVASCSATTGEDFVKETAFAEAIQEISQKFNIAALPIAQLAGVGSKVGVLKDWLSRSAVPQPDISKSLEHVKEAVFTDLKSSHVLPDYYRYLSGVLSSMNGL